MRKIGIAVFITFLLATPAYAINGIDGFSDSKKGMLIFLFFGVFCSIIFALFVALRFGLKRPLLSVGAYVSGAVALLYQASNYFSAYKVYSTNLQIWKDVGMKGDPFFIDVAKRNLNFHAYWLYAGLLVVVIYAILDIRSHQQNKKKRMEAIEALEHSFKQESTLDDQFIE